MVAILVASCLSATLLDRGRGFSNDALALAAGLARSIPVPEAAAPADECEQVSANPLFLSLDDALADLSVMRCSDLFPPLRQSPRP